MAAILCDNLDVVGCGATRGEWTLGSIIKLLYIVHSGGSLDAISGIMDAADPVVSPSGNRSGRSPKACLCAARLLPYPDADAYLRVGRLEAGRRGHSCRWWEPGDPL